MKNTMKNAMNKSKHTVKSCYEKNTLLFTCVLPMIAGFIFMGIGRFLQFTFITQIGEVIIELMPLIIMLGILKIIFSELHNI